MPEIQIARAEERDLPEIQAIYNHAILHSTATFDVAPRTDPQQLEWFRRHGDKHPVFVARAGGEVVGWASLNVFHERCAYEKTVENSVYVREDWQHRGVGRSLLAALIDAARALGHHSIVARIADHNPASIALHRALGFRESGELREAGRKFDRWIDVTLMQLILE